MPFIAFNSIRTQLNTTQLNTNSTTFICHRSHSGITDHILRCILVFKINPGIILGLRSHSAMQMHASQNRGSPSAPSTFFVTLAASQPLLELLACFLSHKQQVLAKLSAPTPPLDSNKKSVIIIGTQNESNTKNPSSRNHFLWMSAARPCETLLSWRGRGRGGGFGFWPRPPIPSLSTADFDFFKMIFLYSTSSKLEFPRFCSNPYGIPWSPNAQECEEQFISPKSA